MKILETKKIDISSLKPHPKNYRQHPEDQLAHLVRSIKQNGVYKNIVVSSDMTILAGHGIAEACKCFLVEVAQVEVGRTKNLSCTNSI